MSSGGTSHEFIIVRSVRDSIGVMKSAFFRGAEQDPRLIVRNFHQRRLWARAARCAALELRRVCSLNVLARQRKFRYCAALGSDMVQRVSTVAFEGIEVRPVDVQVQIAPGMPAFTIVECQCQSLWVAIDEWVPPVRKISSPAQGGRLSKWR